MKRKIYKAITVIIATIIIIFGVVSFIIHVINNDEIKRQNSTDNRRQNTSSMAETKSDEEKSTVIKEEMTSVTEESDETEEDWIENTERFRISAHRGAVKAAPENTILAFEKAIEMEYGAVELDPRISLDGTIYLMHDDDVSRTTDGSGVIENMTDDEIDLLNIDTSEYPDLEESYISVPQFEDAVNVISQSDLVLNVDCSKMDWSNEADLKQLIDILNEYEMYERTFMVISNEDERNIVHGLYPDLCVSWLYDPENSIESEIERIQEYPRAMLSISDDYATESRITAMNEAGIYYQVYNVETVQRMLELKEAGVPMIETNHIIP